MYATGNKRTGGKTWLEKGTLPGMRDTLAGRDRRLQELLRPHTLTVRYVLSAALRKAGDVV